MGHAMSNLRRKKRPHELADLILQHDPNDSMEMIANVVSEWSDLSDDQRFGDHEQTDIEIAETDQTQTGV
jgi:hypothetical protein